MKKQCPIRYCYYGDVSQNYTRWLHIDYIYKKRGRLHGGRSRVGKIQENIRFSLVLYHFKIFLSIFRISISKQMYLLYFQ